MNGVEGQHWRSRVGHRDYVNWDPFLGPLKWARAETEEPTNGYYSAENSKGLTGRLENLGLKLCRYVSLLGRG